jgi:hypothetical protein
MESIRVVDAESPNLRVGPWWIVFAMVFAIMFAIMAMTASGAAFMGTALHPDGHRLRRLDRHRRGSAFTSASKPSALLKSLVPCRCDA